MCLSAPLELSLSLSAPYLDHYTLSSLSLVSRDVADVVFPLIFRGLKSLSANNLSADLLRTLLNTTYPWRHASYVRNVVINVEKLQHTPSNSTSPLTIRTPEEAISAIISSLPNLQHVKIISQCSPNKCRSRYPVRNFAPIAQSLAARQRLCSFELDGQWLGGWSCPIELLQRAGEYGQKIGMSITEYRDGAVCAALCSAANRLEHLSLAGSLDREQIERIVDALPCPEKLRSLRLTLGRNDDKAWWCESFFNRLIGLEELEISTVYCESDYDYSPDPFFSQRSAAAIAEEQRLEAGAKDTTFRKFYNSHPSLTTLIVRGGPSMLTTVRRPPHIYTIADAYDVNLLVLAQMEQHLPYGAHLEDAGIYTPEGFARINRGRRVRHVERESARVQTWAKGITEIASNEAGRLVGDFTGRSRTMKWYPYQCGSEEDGEYVCEFGFGRTRLGGLTVEGGLKHILTTNECQARSEGTFDVSWRSSNLDVMDCEHVLH